MINRLGARVEIRRYGPRLAAEVDLAVAGEAGRSEAFKLLFAYIAGANRASVSGNGKIAMTVPVEVSGKERLAMTAPVHTSETNGSLKMRFFLPAKFSRENAPKPLNPRVRLVATSNETIAILRFSGSGHDFAERQTELMASLVGLKWRLSGEPYTLNYDAPLTACPSCGGTRPRSQLWKLRSRRQHTGRLSEPTYSWLNCAQTRTIFPLNSGSGTIFARVAFSSILQMHIGSPFIFVHLQG